MAHGAPKGVGSCAARSFTLLGSEEKESRLMRNRFCSGSLPRRRLGEQTGKKAAGTLNRERRRQAMLSLGA